MENSFLYLVGLRIFIFLFEISRFHVLVDIGHHSLPIPSPVEQDLRAIFVDNLHRSYAQPEYCAVAGAMVSCHVALHCVVSVFSELHLLESYSDLVGHFFFSLGLRPSQISYKMIKNFILFLYLLHLLHWFVKFVDDCASFINLLVGWIVVDIFHPILLTVSDRYTWIIVPETHCIWIQNVSHSVFGILYKLIHPHL